MYINLVSDTENFVNKVFIGIIFYRVYDKVDYYVVDIDLHVSVI